MRTPEALERVAYEFAVDCQLDNVLYVEPRFSPQLLASPHFSPREVLTTVQRGLARARDEYNAHVAPGGLCFEFGIIVCAMRFFNGHFSPYYERLASALPHLTTKELAGTASLSLVHDAVAARDLDGVQVLHSNMHAMHRPQRTYCCYPQVVALDIAGAESGFPCDDHIPAYRCVTSQHHAVPDT
jgi:adenosine deaminase